MTSEQRLDRLERIAKLFAKAGLRARSEFRKQYEILMDAQMRNEARFARNEERFAQLAESQIHTDRRLDALIDIVQEGRRGNPLPNA
ncbi:MAG TPA: hypothetical protein VEW46_05550 [Pyrinomonadaceae bacterium]|nr:hypothetical protein [Pyrinomonadaceae bacterium]